MEDSYGFDPTAQMNQYQPQPVYVADANAYDYQPNAYVPYEAVPPTQHCPTQGLYPPDEWGAYDAYSQFVPDREEEELEEEEEGEENDDDEYAPYKEKEKEQPHVQLKATAARPAQQVPAPVVESTPPLAARESATEKNSPEYKNQRRLNNEASARCRDKKRKKEEEEKQKLWSTLSSIRTDIDSLRAGVETGIAGMRQELQAVFDHFQRSIDQLSARIDERETVVRL